LRCVSGAVQAGSIAEGPWRNTCENSFKERTNVSGAVQAGSIAEGPWRNTFGNSFKERTNAQMRQKVHKVRRASVHFIPFIRFEIFFRLTLSWSVWPPDLQHGRAFQQPAAKSSFCTRNPTLQHRQSTSVKRLRIPGKTGKNPGNFFCFHFLRFFPDRSAVLPGTQTNPIRVPFRSRMCIFHAAAIPGRG